MNMLQSLRNLKIPTRLFILLFFTVLITLFIALLGILSIRTLQKGPLAIYNDRVVDLRQLKTISDLYGINILTTGSKINDGDITNLEAIKKIMEAQNLIRQEWQAYTGTDIIEKELVIIKTLTPLMEQSDKVFLQIISELRNNDMAALKSSVDLRLYAAISPILEGINKLVDIQIIESENVIRDTNSYFNRSFIIFCVFGIALIFVLVILIRDVTLRKKIEDSLIASNNRYRLLVESSPICIHEIDMSGKIVSMNYAGLLMMGMKDECEVQGLLYLDAVSAPDQARIGELLRKAYAGETSYFEFKASGPNGRIFKSCFAPVKNNEGKIEKLMGITEDITERKKSEDALIALKNDLENRVIERTKELEAANLELESFSYSISHDLRAPLRAIDGFSSILQENYASLLDKEGLRLFQVVKDNAQKMAKLINDILAFSRAGRQEPALSAIDMNTMVDQVWQELQPQRSNRSIEFHMENLLPANADPVALHQVWQNLLSNAIKFTKTREKAVIRAESYGDQDENIL